jgi:ParB family chromosome partitioning protein
MDKSENIMESVMFVPLHRLAPGEAAPGGSINVRKTVVDKASDEQIKASLLAEGVIQSVLACQMDDLGDTLYVAAGNRRLRLLTELHDEGKIPADFHVPAVVKKGLTTAQARALSLAENIARAPLHPVDRFEAFKQHADDGMSEADIGARYAMPKKSVKQALALGALSPAIRDLWRAGKMDAGVVQAFTLAPTHEAQDEALAKLGGRAHGSYQVREAILGGQRDVAGSLKFVGRKEYEKAGGAIVEDLFEGGKYVSDAALLATLVNNKLSEECDRLTSKDGWSWALTAADVGNARYTWRSIEAEPVFTKEQAGQKSALDAKLLALEGVEPDDYDHEAVDVVNGEIETLMDVATAAGFTAAQKAKAGCIVSIDNDGTLKIEAGFVRPTDVGKLDATDSAPADKAKADKKKETGGLSEALANRLTEQFTVAAGHALDHDPHVALCALLAGFITTYGSPVRVSTDGMGADHGKAEKFETVFARVLGMNDKARKVLLTKTVASTFDLRLFTRQRQSIQPKAIAALVDALPARAMNVELRRLFDAKDYFEGANKTLCLAAIEEAVSKDEARKVASKPKGEIAKVALACVPKTGWLPDALRTAHYDGPGAKGKTKSAKPKAKR